MKRRIRFDNIKERKNIMNTIQSNLQKNSYIKKLREYIQLLNTMNKKSENKKAEIRKDVFTQIETKNKLTY